MESAFSEANLGIPSAKRESGERPHWLHCMALDKALGQPGCVVCNHLARCERKAINGFLYESMIDSDVRRQFLDAGGFCRRHFAIACDIEKECWPSGGIAMAILCEDLLSGALDTLREATEAGVPPRFHFGKRSGFGPYAPGERCMFCAEQRGSEASFLAALEALLDFESVAADLTPGRLCLVHAQAACERWQDAAKRACAAELARRHAQELLGLLEECVWKYDYRFREEPSGNEREAVPRSMRFLAGGKESQ